MPDVKELTEKVVWIEERMHFQRGQIDALQLIANGLGSGKSRAQIRTLLDTRADRNKDKEFDGKDEESWWLGFINIAAEFPKTFL